MLLAIVPLASGLPSMGKKKEEVWCALAM